MGNPTSTFMSNGLGKESGWQKLMGLTLIDFKVAMRAAWTVLDPTHHVLGCLFHLTQVLKPWVE